MKPLKHFCAQYCTQLPEGTPWNFYNARKITFMLHEMAMTVAPEMSLFLVMPEVALRRP